MVQQIVDYRRGGGRPIKDVYISGALKERRTAGLATT